MENEIAQNKKLQHKTYKKIIDVNILSSETSNPIWLSLSEASKIGGVQTKTIRRAIQDKTIKYIIVGNRYAVDLRSTMHFLHSKTKLKNKLNQFGIGQYVEKWKK